MPKASGKRRPGAQVVGRNVAKTTASSALTRKVSLAIGRKELEWAIERAKRKGVSLSSEVTAAMRAVRRRDERLARQRVAWSAYVDWATDGKGVSPEEQAEGAADLDAARAETARRVAALQRGEG